MKQTVRIIGGLYRGKKINFPNATGLRPTPDRVRETLFNWLMQDIRQARCLDAFAGSGALGFEALSRGARQVVMLEQSPAVYQQLKQNLSSFSEQDRVTLLHVNSEQYLANKQPAFDIIFLDPPFNSDLLQTCIKHIESQALLKPGGFLYLESSQEVSLSEETWQVYKAKKAGQVFYSLFQALSR